MMHPMCPMYPMFPPMMWPMYPLLPPPPPPQPAEEAPPLTVNVFYNEREPSVDSSCFWRDVTPRGEIE